MTRTLFLLASIFGMAQVADACAVCGVGKEESRMAFIITTVILSLVPLIMIGGGSYLVYRRYQTSDSRHEDI